MSVCRFYTPPYDQESGITEETLIGVDYPFNRSLHNNTYCSNINYQKEHQFLGTESPCLYIAQQSECPFYQEREVDIFISHNIDFGDYKKTIVLEYSYNVEGSKYSNITMVDDQFATRKTLYNFNLPKDEESKMKSFYDDILGQAYNDPDVVHIEANIALISQKQDLEKETVKPVTSFLEMVT